MSQLEALFVGKNFKEMIAEVNSAVEPTDIDIAWRGDAHFMLGDFENALSDYKFAMQAQSLSFHINRFQRARTALKRVRISEAGERDFWTSCSDALSRDMGEIADRLLSGDINGIEEVFRDKAEQIFPDAEIAARWLKAFNSLVRGVSGEDLPPIQFSDPRRKIIVSGMGWSGSSAIFDHLREYKQVATLKGESTAFEGTGGFQGFIDASGSAEACLAQTVTFFFRNMLGYYPMRNASCFKELRSARKTSGHRKAAAIYAEGADEVVVAMIQLLRSIERGSGAVHEALKVLCSAISERMVTQLFAKDAVVLLDNCIHIKSLDLMRYMSNTVLLCCFRDPRTNYIALKREFPGFDRSLKQFIDGYRRARAEFSDTLNDAMKQELIQSDSHVEALSFESFVVSEAQRQRLAALAGVDPKLRNAFTHFKPWVSFRNTQLHLDYENPEEVEAITAALPEFCVDFSAVLPGAPAEIAAAAE